MKVSSVVTVLLAVLFASSTIAASPYDKPGFITFEKEGRLWVFKEGSKALTDFEKHGEPSQVVSLIGAGPNGMTVKGADNESLKAYLDLINAK